MRALKGLARLKCTGRKRGRKEGRKARNEYTSVSKRQSGHGGSGTVVVEAAATAPSLLRLLGRRDY